MTEPPTSAPLTPLAVVLAFSLCAFFMGGYLIERGWLLVGGAAIFIGVLIISTVMKPERVAELFVSVFATAWSGYGAVSLLREGRYFAFVPLLLVFVIAALNFRARLFKKTPPSRRAADTLIEGQVTATREEQAKPIQSSEG